VTDQVVSPLVHDSPYRGLVPYSEDDHDRFFGRDNEREIIISNLLARRLTLLYGESGVGKSSVLHAGVAHHLRLRACRDLDERGAARVVPVVFSDWRDDPVAALAEALRGQLTEFAPGDAGPEPAPAGGLDELIDGWSRRLRAKLVLILDQFEEWFVYRRSDNGARSLTAELPGLINRDDLRANVLIAIREDALAKLDVFKRGLPQLMHNRLRIRHLDATAARKAIEEPIKAFNATHRTDIGWEPELVAAVLDQIEAGKVSLSGQAGRGAAADEPLKDDRRRIETPYLQLVMTRLWDEEMAAGSSMLRLETLERLGGARQIVLTHLDNAMSALPADDQDVAADVFHFLVTPSGTKIAYTVDDLAEYAERQPREVEPLLERLASSDSRIIRPVSDGEEGVPRYEIFHDVLAAAVLDWRERHVQAVERRRLAARVEEERSAKELAEGEAQAERTRATRFKMLAAGCVLLALVAAGACWYAVDKQGDAEAAREKADMTARHAESALVSERPAATGRTDLSLLAALEGYRLAPTLEARSGALALLQRNAGLPWVMDGHENWVNGLALASTRGLLASASDDWTVRLWDVKNGRAIGAPLQAHTDTVNAVAFSLDGRTLAAASENGSALLWDVSDPARPLELPSAGVTGGAAASTVAFSPDGRTLATGLADGTVALWEAHDPAQVSSVGRLDTNAGNVLGLAWGRGGMLATGGSRGRISLWEVAPGRRPRLSVAAVSRRGHKAVNSLAFSAAGDRMAAADGDGTVELWRISRAGGARSEALLRGHFDVVDSVAFGAGDKLLVSGSDDNAVQVWNLARRPIERFGPPRTHDQDAIAVTADPRSELIVSSGGDHLIKLWRADGRGLALVLGNRPDAFGNVVLADDDTVAIATKTDGARVWPLGRIARDGATLAPSPSGRPTYFGHTKREPKVAAHGGVVALSDGSEIQLWDVRDPARPRTRGTAVAQPADYVWALAFSSRGNLLASGDASGNVVLWDVSGGGTPQHRATLSAGASDGGVQAIEFDPTRPLLAVAHNGGAVTLWNVGDPRKPVQVGRPLSLHEGYDVYTLAFSPTGMRLASGGADQHVVVSDVSDPARPRTVGVPILRQNNVVSLAYSPDGRMLAVGDDDATITLWEAGSLRPIGAQLSASETNVETGTDSLQFSRDGRFLVSTRPLAIWSSALWSDDLGTLRRYGCQIVRRNLTRAEWDSVFADTELVGHWRPTCG
jgi:WD40 repeat protein